MGSAGLLLGKMEKNISLYSALRQEAGGKLGYVFSFCDLPKRRKSLVSMACLKEKKNEPV